VTAARTHYKELIDTDWLGQWDFPPGREVTVEIASIERYKPKRVRTVKGPDGRKVPERNKRLDVSFVGKRKHWLAGPVSQQSLAAMFGPIIQDWIGKKITLYVDASVMMGRQKTGGVRVRPTAATGPTTEDPMDRDVDEEQAQAIADAFADEGGESGVAQPGTGGGA
jgi:hypothetical protein